MEAKHWFALAAAVGLGAEVAACSSDFSSCEDSRTCIPSGAGGNGDAGEADEPGGAGAGGKGQAGSGGKGQTAGAPATDAGAPGVEAGAGGEPPTAACDRDSDCNDDLACNGVETCVDGACKSGVSPCANPQLAHCVGMCTEKDGAASCGVKGEDIDKDGHLSEACTLNPGDDCDDSVPTVYPGAPELCDGLDNNCNQKVDLSDGLSVGGMSRGIGPDGATRYEGSIAWATDKSLYGIAYLDTTSSSAADLYFELVDQTGAVKLAPKAVNDATSKPTNGLDLTWGGDSFGLAWNANNLATHFKTISGTGSLAAPSIRIPSFNPNTNYDNVYAAPAIAGIAGGSWGILRQFHDGGDTDYNNWVDGFTVSPTGAIPKYPTQLSAGDAQFWSIATSGANFVTATTTYGAASKSVLYSSTFGSPKSLSAPGRGAIVGASASGFAVAARAVSDSDPPNFYSFNASGAAVCGPVPFTDKAFAPVDLVATPKGYLVLSSGYGNLVAATQLKIQEVFSDCTLGALFTVDSGLADGAQIAAGSAGYGVTWYDTTAKVPKARFFGPHYCD
jgi:Putative metal-binding motif